MVRVLNVGILHREYDMSKAMEDEAQQIVKRMSQFMPVLDTMITVAPMLGILGTVTGIIRTFMEVSMNEEALGRTEVLAGGIYEALVATAVGLFIAITSLVLYFFFQERVDRLVAQVDETMSAVIERLSIRAEARERI